MILSDFALPHSRLRCPGAHCSPISCTRRYVVKRNGQKQEVKFDKITARIKKLCYGLNETYVNPASVAMKVIPGLYPGVTTSELDELAAQTCAYQATPHPERRNASVLHP